VVPADAMAAAGDYLRGASIDVETHLRRGLGHAIDPEGIMLGGRFLARHLRAAAS
jgi:phospholipase/carboxylesterase